MKKVITAILMSGLSLSLTTGFAADNKTASQTNNKLFSIGSTA